MPVANNASPDLLIGRYAILETLETATAWGGVYLAQAYTTDDGPPPRPVVVREMRIPPLRSGLEERMQRVRETLDEWRSRTHPSRAVIHDIVEEPAKLWIVSERAPGMSVRRWIQRKKISHNVTWRAAVATALATAMRSLLSMPHCSQFIPSLSAQQVFVTPEGKVTLACPGAGRYFKPGAPGDLSREALEAAAVTRYGELLYSLIVGEEFRRGDIILETQLPEDLGDFILRTLTTRADSYKSLEAIEADVTVFNKIVSAESSTLLTWDDLNLEEVKTDWRKRWLPPFLFHATERWFHFAEGHASVVRALEIGLLVSFLVTLGLTWVQNRPVRFGHVSGTSILVAEEDGGLECIDVTNGVTAGWAMVGGNIEAMIFSSKLRRALLSMPSTHEIVSLDLNDNSLVRADSPDPPRKMVLLAGLTVALAMNDSGSLQMFEVATLRSAKPTTLPQRPLDIAYISAARAVAYLEESGESLTLYSLAEKRVVASRRLPTQVRRIRYDWRDKLIWLLPAPGSVEVSAVQAQTLDTVHTYTLAERAIDVALGNDLYFLLENSGDVSVVSRTSFELAQAPLHGMEGARRILLSTPNDLWFLGRTNQLEEHTVDESLPPRRVLLHSTPLDFILSNPVERAIP